MARKKDQAVMENITDEAEFNTFIDKRYFFVFLNRNNSSSGLCVVDVYQTWCGPCKPVQVLFKRLKVELGQSNVQFATADTERVPQMVSYAGDCEPIFLLYGGGKNISHLIWRNKLCESEDDVIILLFRKSNRSYKRLQCAWNWETDSGADCEWNCNCRGQGEAHPAWRGGLVRGRRGPRHCRRHPSRGGGEHHGHSWNWQTRLLSSHQTRCNGKGIFAYITNYDAIKPLFRQKSWQK